jgi:hypothetical protein
MFSTLYERLPSPSTLLEYIPSKDTLSGYVPSRETLRQAPTYLKDGFYYAVGTVQSNAKKAGERIPCPEIVTRWAGKATTLYATARNSMAGKWEQLGGGEWVTKALQFLKMA